MTGYEIFEKMDLKERDEVLRLWTKNSNFTLIQKDDHLLLLDNHDTLRKELHQAQTDLDNLRNVRRSNELMERCATIDSLVACLKVPMINYLDDFGKPVDNVSPFRGEDINQITKAIMNNVDAIERGTHLER